jgi:hypothetical protein
MSLHLTDKEKEKDKEELKELMDVYARILRVNQSSNHHLVIKNLHESLYGVNEAMKTLEKALEKN